MMANPTSMSSWTWIMQANPSKIYARGLDYLVRIMMKITSRYLNGYKSLADGLALIFVDGHGQLGYKELLTVYQNDENKINQLQEL